VCLPISLEPQFHILPELGAALLPLMKGSNLSTDAHPLGVSVYPSGEGS
jgi:hypothetical protein